MTDLHHWARVKALFLEAADLDPGARQLFLDRETGGDPVLRGQVEEMLAADEGAGDFLEESASGLLAGGVAELLAQTAAFQGGFLPGGAPGLPSPSPWVGRRFGPYEVVGELGRGGVGVVLLGVRADGRYDRKVALKVVPASMVQGHLADRFRTEIRILGELDHPNIARLLDAGETPEGLAYLVMEYVDGPRIDHFADGGSLDVRARLALFRKVLDGVDYAHARGVVHRDLKPSNILVSASGEPKLVDFGIARLLEPREEGSSQPDPTRSALRMMTLEYASPEQVRGESLDPRTDVYSAGVVLYRLLTGFPPYSLDTTAPYGAERVICEEAPTRPSIVVTRAAGGASPGITVPQGDPDILARQRSSTRDRLQRQFRGDLDTLVLHSLSKERERRYATAGAFGDDIDRYLEGSPIRASAPGLGYRTRHFLRRRRVALAATLAASLALLAVGSQAREAHLQRTAAETRSVELTGVVNSVLQTLDRDMAGEDLGPTATRAAAVEAAVRSLDEVLARSTESPGPELLRELANGYRQVGMLQGHPFSPNVGRVEESQQSFERSLDLWTRLAATDGGSLEARMGIANTQVLLGDIHRNRGNVRETARLLEQARATTDSLAREHPETTPLLRSQIVVHERLTWQAEAQGDLPGAVALAERMSGFSARLAALTPPGAARASSVEALALTLQ
jgi:eukaryotic-like serine/threonine-protein kinase